MMPAEWIKQHLAGSDPQHAIARTEMIRESGLTEGALDDALERLYNQGIVNRVHILREGLHQVYYWLTGATLKTVPWQTRLPGSSTTPRRAPQRLASASKEQAMPQDPPAAGKSRGRLMLEYLAEHGRATGKQLCIASGAESVTSYLSGPIKRGHVLVSESGDNRHGKTYQVAPGVTREVLLADARCKNIPPHKLAEMAEQRHEPPAPQSNVVEFKRETAQAAVQQELPERGMTAHDICVDPDGQLVIQLPGKVRMVFPAPDTKRIKAYLAAIDLESLCA